MLSPNHNIHKQDNNEGMLYLFEQLQPYKKTKTYKKGEVVVPIGEVSNKFVYVQEGILRTYYLNQEGEEVISGFTFQGDVDIVAYSFFLRKVSKEEIVALTDCVLDVYYYNNTIEVISQNPNLANVVFGYLSMYIETLEKRLFEMRNLNAVQRYQNLKETYKDEIDKIPDYLLASYLGISKERMSRIKNNR